MFVNYKIIIKILSLTTKVGRSVMVGILVKGCAIRELLGAPAINDILRSLLQYSFKQQNYADDLLVMIRRVG